MSSDRLYPDVERLVLWGESTQSVYEMLAVNAVTGKEADALINRAMRERISTIRAHFRPRIFKRLILMAAGASFFSAFWFYNGGITRNLFVLSALVAAWGAWWVIEGGVGWLSAPSRKGSVAEL